MSLTDGTGLSATDIMALTGNNNDAFGGNGMGGWWIIVFLLLIFGWGGRGFGNNAGSGDSGFNGMAVPYMYAGVQQGFDQSAVMNALSNLNTAIANGFAAQSVDACNKTMTTMQAINGVQMQMANNHSDILMQMGNYEMARQKCCCDAQLQTANLQATLLAEHCSDRAEIDRAMNQLSTQMNAGFQDIKDQLAQNKYDELKTKYDEAIQKNTMAELLANNNVQTQALVANNQAQTDRIMDFINPGYARPFYGWPQNSPCNCNQNVGCCGNA